MRSQTNRRTTTPDPENPAVRIGLLYGLGPYPVRPAIIDPLGNQIFYLPHLADTMVRNRVGFLARLFGR